MFLGLITTKNELRSRIALTDEDRAALDRMLTTMRAYPNVAAAAHLRGLYNIGIVWYPTALNAYITRPTIDLVCTMEALFTIPSRADRVFFEKVAEYVGAPASALEIDHWKPWEPARSRWEWSPT